MTTTFEIGQTITSSHELSDLPAGAVVIREGEHTAHVRGSGSYYFTDGSSGNGMFRVIHLPKVVEVKLDLTDVDELGLELRKIYMEDDTLESLGPVHAEDWRNVARFVHEHFELKNASEKPRLVIDGYNDKWHLSSNGFYFCNNDDNPHDYGDASDTIDYIREEWGIIETVN